MNCINPDKIVKSTETIQKCRLYIGNTFLLTIYNNVDVNQACLEYLEEQKINLTNLYITFVTSNNTHIWIYGGTQVPLKNPKLTKLTFNSFLD